MNDVALVAVRWALYVDLGLLFGLPLFALYAPFWVRGSAADLDGLRAMAGEWEFNSSIFAIVQAVATREVAEDGGKLSLSFTCYGRAD